MRVCWNRNSWDIFTPLLLFVFFPALAGGTEVTRPDLRRRPREERSSGQQCIVPTQLRVLVCSTVLLITSLAVERSSQADW